MFAFLTFTEVRQKNNYFFYTNSILCLSLVHFLLNLPFCCCSWACQFSALMGCDTVSGEVNNQCWKKGLSLLTQPRMETQWPSFGEKQKKNPELYLALKISRDLALTDQAITLTLSCLTLSSHHSTSHPKDRISVKPKKQNIL